jgi:NTE family protein
MNLTFPTHHARSDGQKVKKLHQGLQSANDYQEWKEIAQTLDSLEGLNQWKQDNSSPYYDSELIASRLIRLRRYRLNKKDVELVRILREGLHHDLGNIGHPLLYGYAYFGTKKLIEDYIEEVCICLNYVCDQDLDFLPLAEKFKFFEDTAHSYGQPALMFSGGATLGLFHSGVCKALQEHDLLPKVFSGSSAGALTAGMLGTRTDEEMQGLYNGDDFYEYAFHFRKLADILKGGGIADVQVLKKFIRNNLGEYTFEEAFAKTGRHINMAVAPFDGSQAARIMNELTSPYLLMWSAALASCAVPVLFPPIKLTAKSASGEYKPYMSSLRWVDGSVRSDFPRTRLSRLYNINYTIAVQVNPHIVPFMQTDRARYRRDVLSWPSKIIRGQGKVLAMGAMDFTRERFGNVASIRRMLDHGYGIIGQRYYGDINVIANYGLRHYGYTLKNPSQKLLRVLQREGERATWPKISAIQTHSRVGKTLQHCLERLNQKRMMMLKALLPQTDSAKELFMFEANRHHSTQF